MVKHVKVNALFRNFNKGRLYDFCSSPCLSHAKIVYISHSPNLLWVQGQGAGSLKHVSKYYNICHVVQSIHKQIVG